MAGKAKALHTLPQIVRIILPVGLVAGGTVPLLGGPVHVTIPFDLLPHGGVTLEAEGIQGRLDLEGVVGRVDLVTGQAFIPLERGVLLLFLKLLEKLLVTRVTALFRCRGEEKLGGGGMGIVALTAVSIGERGMQAETIPLFSRLLVADKTEILLPPGEKLSMTGIVRGMAREAIPLHGWIVSYGPFQESLMAGETDLVS